VTRVTCRSDGEFSKRERERSMRRIAKGETKGRERKERTQGAGKDARAADMNLS